MKRLLLSSFGLFTAAGLGQAQQPAQNYVPGMAHVSAVAGPESAPVVSNMGGAWQNSAPAPQGPQMWGGFEYLLWWVRPGPVSAPIVTSTFVPADLGATFAAGGLADPNAYVAFGNQNVGFGTISGMRFTSGLWLDNCQTVGVDSSLYFLEQRSASFAAASDANGVPNLGLSFNSVTPGFPGETAGIFAGQLGNVVNQGVVAIRMTSQLWGSDTNLLRNLWKSDCRNWRVDALVGVKFLQLEEDLNIFAAVLNNTGGTIADQFATRNRFYGAQLGTRVSGQVGHFGGQLTGKVAFGDNNQTLDINGYSIPPTNVGVPPGPGGAYAQSSNIGSTSTDRFGMVPEITGNVYYDVTCNIRVFVGYNWMYWTNVMRPGDQVDRNVNLNLTPGFGGGPGGAGPQAPTRLNRETDFWAHGVSFGVAIQF